MRCTLITEVGQILSLTKLISEIKVYSIQRSFILSTRLFTTYFSMADILIAKLKLDSHSLSKVKY